MKFKTLVLGAAAAALGFSVPAYAGGAYAGRGIQIDINAQPADGYWDLLGLGYYNPTLGTEVYISNNGWIRLGSSSLVEFAVASSGQTFDVYTGYTGSPEVGTIGLISYFAPGTFIEDGITAPLFQYSLRTISGNPDVLEVGYAYSAGGAPAGATIGVTIDGQTLYSVTNDNGLRLGEGPDDSNFVFYLSELFRDEEVDGVPYSTPYIGLVNPTTFDVRRNAVEAPPPAVPEPSTWAMFLLGFGGIGALLRRRKRQALAEA